MIYQINIRCKKHRDTGEDTTTNSGSEKTKIKEKLKRLFFQTQNLSLCPHLYPYAKYKLLKMHKLINYPENHHHRLFITKLIGHSLCYNSSNSQTTSRCRTWSISDVNHMLLHTSSTSVENEIFH